VAEQFEVAGILGAGRCNVIHNGLDLNYYKGGEALARPAELTNGPVIGTVGSLTTEKGTADLLRAVVGLCEDNPDLTICAVGDGPLRAALETLARQLGIAQHVLFVGVVEDVRPWIASFDVFALPSRSEGMGRVLVEAMALGCPIVATDVGGIREAVGDAARLAEPGNPARLGEMLGQLLENREMRCQLVEAGKERAKRFSLDEMASRTADLYENCLARTRAA
jgi:glycosyltransferase involved in cell wall biosynthesis